MPEIRVLSVRQPYAALIVSGFKTVELRSRRTHFRGEVFIHAGLRVAKVQPIRTTVLSQLPIDLLNVKGAVIGRCFVDNCRASEPNDNLQAHHDVWKNSWSILLSKASLLETPVVLRGQLGFFRVPSQTWIALHDR